MKTMLQCFCVEWQFLRFAFGALSVALLPAVGCDSLQGENPVAAPAGYVYPGLAKITKNQNGTYTLIWPAAPFENVSYKVFQRAQSEKMDWEKFTVTELTTFVSDDMRFSPATCFAVRFFTPTVTSDSNTTEICTEGFSYEFKGISAIGREGPGTYRLTWPKADIPGVSYRVYEASDKGELATQPLQETEAESARVGPYALGEVRCFAVRVSVEGFPDFDKNTKILCNDENRLSTFIGIESLNSEATGAVTLRWSSDPNPDVVGYLVYRGTDFKETVARVDSRLQTSVVFKDLEPFSLVSFGVRAITALGSEDKNTRTASVRVRSSLPLAFQGAKAIVLESFNKALLSWQPVANASEYRIYEAVVPLNVEPSWPAASFQAPKWVVPASENSVEQKITGLGDETRYCYIVRAVSIFGIEDSNQNAVCADTPDAGPPQFAGIKSAVVKDGKVVLTWNAALGQVSNYRIYVAKGSASALDFTQSSIPPEPAESTTAVIAGFQNGADYTFAVLAEDRNGKRDANKVTATLTAAAQSLPVFFGYIGAQGIDERRIELKFKGTPDANVSSYTIDVRKVGQSRWAERFYLSQDLSKSELSQLVNNLTPDTEYEFLVRSVDRWGNSSNNESPIRGRTLDETPPQFAGIESVSQPAGRSLLNLVWAPAPDRDIAEYAVYYSENSMANLVFSRRAPLPVSIKFAGTVPSASNSYSIEGLTKGRNYFFVVRALDIYGNEDANTVQVQAVVQNTFPSIGADEMVVSTPEGVAGKTVTLTASDPDLNDPLVFELQPGSTCDFASAPVVFQVQQRVGKQVSATLNWLPPPGYILSGKESRSCTITYRAKDADSMSPPLAITLTAVNRPPFNVAATIQPIAGGFKRSQNLVCAGTADDDDGNLPTISFAWLKNGAVLAGATSATLTPAQANYAPGDKVRCVATADDDHVRVSAESDEVAMGNTAPDLQAAFLSKDSGTMPLLVGDSISCKWSARDLDGDAMTFGALSVEQSVDGGSTWGPAALPETTCGILENNKKCFTVDASVRRAKLRCTVGGVSDGFAAMSGPFSSSVRDVSNSTPVVTGLAIVANRTAFEVGTRLTCNRTVSDRDNDVLTLPEAISWYRGSSKISGATGMHYDIQIADRDQPLACEVVIPANADGFGSAQVGPLRSAAVTYNNSAPSVQNVSVSPNSAVTGTALQCNFNLLDPDGDTVSSGAVSIRWLKGDGTSNMPIVNEVATTYTVQAQDRGQRIMCEVSLNANADGRGSQASSPVVSTNFVVPQNSAPVVSNVQLVVLGEAIVTDTILECSADVTDLDGDPLLLGRVFSWTANNIVISNANTSTYMLQRTDRGKTIRCRVGLPPDADGKGSAIVNPVSSLVGVVPVNTQPEISGVTVNSVSSAPHYIETEFTCNAATVRDKDRDPIFPVYRWYRNGAQIEGANLYSYVAQSADRDAYLTCAYHLPANGDGAGSDPITVASANEKFVANRLPVGSFAPSLSVSGGGSLFKTSTITCRLPTGAALPNPLDPDLDTLTYRYLWYKNGTLLSGTDSSGTLSDQVALAGRVTQNDVMTCRVVLNDGRGSVNSLISANVSVQNRAPVILGTPSLGPATVFTSAVTRELNCNLSESAYSDPDGDPVTLRFGFAKAPSSANLSFSPVDSSISSLLSSAFYSSSNTLQTSFPSMGKTWAAGELLRCSAQVSDPYLASDSANSTDIGVNNSAPTGTFTCNSGISEIKGSPDEIFAPTGACDTSSVVDIDAGQTLSFRFDNDPAHTTCSGTNISINVDPSNGKISGQMPSASCKVSVVLEDSSGALTTSGGVVQRATFDFLIPFNARLLPPQTLLDGSNQCFLRVPTSFTALAEGYGSSSVSTSALGQSFQHLDPQNTAGQLNIQIDPNIGGNLLVNWIVTGSLGSVVPLSTNILIRSAIASGNRSAVQSGPGMQPLPSIVNNRSSGCSTGNCSGKRASVATGLDFACTLSDDSAAYCWGNNTSGQLGTGTLGNPVPFNSAPPRKVTLDNLVPTAIAAGGNIYTGDSQACAVLADPLNNMQNKGVYCWGSNRVGQLGRGFASAASPYGIAQPAQVSGISGGSGTARVRAIAVGGSHACALFEPVSEAGGGAVKCWGANDLGQLGDSSTTDRYEPVAVANFSSSGALALAAGTVHTCAIDNLRRVQCWGNNSKLQVGKVNPNPLVPYTVVPSVVPGIVDAVALAAGSEHTCALTQSGKVYCWGAMAYGQLGNGEVGFANADPLEVVSVDLANPVAISAGSDHTCALLANGAARCWGLNNTKQLGVGGASALPQETKPMPVANVNNDAVAVSSGHSFTCLLNQQNEIKCFGDNSSLQQSLVLGQGTPVNPVVFPSGVKPDLLRCPEVNAIEL